MLGSSRSRGIPTRLLLAGGVAGPIVFIGAILAQDVARPGYDPIRQFISVLSLGDGGWLQAANFIVSGLLIAAFGLGLGRQVGADARRWTARLLVVAGLALAACGLFSTDPQWGYPSWISAEAAANPTWHSRLHYVFGFAAASALPLAIVLEGRRAAVGGATRQAAYALGSAATMLVCFLAGLAVGGPAAHFAWGGLLQRASIVAGLQWLAWFAVDQVHAAEATPEALDVDAAAEGVAAGSQRRWEPAGR